MRYKLKPATQEIRHFFETAEEADKFYNTCEEPCLSPKKERHGNEFRWVVIELYEDA